MEQEQDKIKIISYNIHSGKNIWMVSQFNHIINFLKYENPDIIGIQEINENVKRGFQVTELKEKLNLETHFGPHVKIKGGYYGIATFSKYPIIEKKHIFLPSRNEQRGYIDTIVLIGSRKVHIINTHLSLSNSERNIQLIQLRDYINSLDSYFILLGDFNTSLAEIDYLLTDSAKSIKKEHLPTMMLYNKRIDYIFVSKCFKVISYNVRLVKMSDHYPVVVELALNN